MIQWLIQMWDVELVESWGNIFLNPSVEKRAMAAKTVNLHDKGLLLRSFEIGFHPSTRSFSASTSRLWYTSLFAKPHCRYQLFGENSKISCEVGNWHLSPSLRRETAVAVPSSLAAAAAAAAATTTTIWLPHSRYSLVYWMWIRTCFSSLDAALECLR